MASLAEPLPYLRRRSKCYPILNKSNFCMGPSQKIVWFSFRLRPSGNSPLQAPVVQMLDSAIHQINHFPADNYVGKQSHYPLEMYPPDSAINLLNNWGRPWPARSACMGILLDLVNIEKLYPRPLSCMCIVGAQSIE